MSEWQPIETYDKLKRKPKLAVFWFAEEVHKTRSDLNLKGMARLERRAGFRTCILWMPLPEPPKEPEHE
jgi:hypothetical protein